MRPRAHAQPTAPRKRLAEGRDGPWGKHSGLGAHNQHGEQGYSKSVCGREQATAAGALTAAPHLVHARGAGKRLVHCPQEAAVSNQRLADLHDVHSLPGAGVGGGRDEKGGG
jgi:hypothetical protein